MKIRKHVFTLLVHRANSHEITRDTRVTSLLSNNHRPIITAMRYHLRLSPFPSHPFNDPTLNVISSTRVHLRDNTVIVYQ